MFLWSYLPFQISGYVTVCLKTTQGDTGYILSQIKKSLYFAINNDWSRNLTLGNIETLQYI